MAIGFARMEFVKRSIGKTACAKAAYNSRSQIHQEASKWTEEKTYDWSYKAKPFYHEIILPLHVDAKFKLPEILWNAVEKAENRKNSVVALDFVIALPDDKVVSNEDKIELAKSFAQQHFVDTGFAVQINMHTPEIGEEGGGEDHNWHAHFLVTPRRFHEDGNSFEKNKPRELITALRNGKVISGPDWGKLWTHHQNAYFEAKGINLRVDPNAIVSQIHLGPVRLRGRAISLLERQSVQEQLNSIESQDPKLILAKMTETQNIFTKEDVDRFLHKYIDADSLPQIKEAFWKQSEIVQLLDPKTAQPHNKFTTTVILEEEQKILRITDRIAAKNAHKLSDSSKFEAETEKLTNEQIAAFKNIITGKRLSCVEGLAGTGKSYLLSALKSVYESEGYVVRGFGPDNATAQVLSGCGFNKAENIYRFLFSYYHGKTNVTKSREVWILDEAGKIGSRPLLEFLKAADKNNVQVILSGDTSQLPSIERGRMFRTFCNRYGRQFLMDIKRQKTGQQREIAKKLASGEIGDAFNAIARSGGFKWSETKQDAIEELVKQWAIDKEWFPNSSTLILAHSNAEMRTLNEFVRGYRKQRGEIGEKEYLCSTANGKIYVSVGDTIEFRRKDTELGVTNGLTGTVVEASENKFVVQVKDREKMRELQFNPNKYRFFQLGYATTYYRSQGRTVDRAYILHSSMMNKEMFYVGLTRHVNVAYCYVSHTEASCLSDLKKQAFRATPLESTTDYLNGQEIAKQKDIETRKQEIQNLKNSELLYSRIKGHTIQSLDSLQTKTVGFLQRFNDRQHDNKFFNPNIQEQVVEPTAVVEVRLTYHEEEPQKHDSQKPHQVVTENRTEMNNENNPSINKNAQKQAWQGLSEKEKALLKEYYHIADTASSLHTIVKTEVEATGRSEKLSSHFQDWQETCGKRNEEAHKITRTIPQEKLRTLFSKGSLEVLKYRSTRHEATPSQTQQPRLEDGLLENIERLLFRLFPDGPIRRDRRGYRYGSKGSLAVVCQGEKAGSFYNFEKGEGGGLFKLIQDVLTLNQDEAVSWAKGFLGDSPTLSTPKRCLQQSIEKNNEDTWVSLKPDAASFPPQLRALSKNLDQQYVESARHAYKDESGQVLFYTLRLLNKLDGSKKITPPLSYGYYKGGEEIPIWSLKGFQIDQKPLYNLDTLSAKPNAAVLIVEGEKTADAALKMFANQNITVVTWSGGSAAVSKTDWTPLFLREVIIWSDNDGPGFKACDDICKELRSVGVKSLRAVNKEVLQKSFPEKWDLADQLPQDMTQRHIQDMILSAEEKAVGMKELFSALVKPMPIEILQAKEILLKVETRRRPQLEEEFGNKNWEINQRIILETVQLLSNKDKVIEQLRKEHNREDTQNQVLAFAILLKHAETGCEPTKNQIDDLRKSSTILSNYQVSEKMASSTLLNKEVENFVLCKYLSNSFDIGFSKRILDKTVSRLKKEIDLSLQQLSRIVDLDSGIGVNKSLEHERLP